MRYSFTSDCHAKRFMKVFRTNQVNLSRSGNRYLATVFLLTSDPVLWERSKDHVLSTTVDFNSINVGSLDTNSYAVYKLAKDIYNLKPNIVAFDYIEHSLLHVRTVENILNAININNSGLIVVKPQKEVKNGKSCQKCNYFNGRYGRCREAS